MVEVVCGVIQNAGGAYLACQRPAGRHLAGLWEFPGGKVDPGESPESALARELWEELAVKVEVGSSLSPVEWTYGQSGIRLRPFLCRIISGEVKALEHEKVLWILPIDFDKIPWAAADIPILRELRPAEGS